MSKITRAWGAAKLALDAKAPTLLVVGGIVTMGIAGVVACVQTTKLEEKIDPYLDELEGIQSSAERGMITAETASHNRGSVYCKVMLEASKVYGVPIVLFAGGAGMAIKGHNILQQRNAALAVAFTTLKKSFDAYRARVIHEQGHEADQHYLNGSKPMKHNGMLVSTRDWDESAQDPYNRIFGQETSTQWENDLGTNKHFVASQQRFAQQLLNRQGYLYLSEVYKSLGLPETDVSRVVGWKITTLPDGTQNIPIVDFGIDKPMPDDWKYNQQRAIFLDFNCQGLIVGGKVQKMLETMTRSQAA